jgi:nucleoid-associated protein YgaU
MSTTRKPAGRPARPQTGAARFQQVAAPAKKSPFESLLAALALGALLIGVPVLLVVIDGPPPIPTSFDLETLTGAVSTEQVISILVGVVWLAWLHFAICTLVEVLAAVRGGALAPHVPLGGASQRLARALVAAMLLSTGIASQASAMVAPTGAGIVASQTVQAAGQNAEGVVAHQEAPHVTAPGQDAVERALQGRKVYTVKPPQGHHHDSLWDIAEKHLGDGRRYQEIFQLNEGREQPDGRRLELARLIQPGWHLVMPEDATGVARWETPVAPAVPVPTQGGANGAALGTGGAADVVAGDQAQLQDQQDQAADQGGFVQHATDPRSLAGAALLAVGLIAALRRARRRGRAGQGTGDAVETEVWLRVGADEERTKRLAAALRGLAGLCEEAGNPVPQAYAAAVDAETVELYLAPPAPEAPAPWSAVDEGRRWRLERASAPRRAQSGVVPYPALVSVGRDMAGRDVLVNLAAAAGAISVTGSPAPAGQVVRALAAELATNSWSDQVRVIGVDLPAELDVLGSERLTRVADPAQALAAISPEAAGPGADQVVSGRRGLAAEGERVDVVLLGQAVASGAVDRLRSIAASAGGSTAVVAAGSLEGARWNLLVDDAGSLHVDALGLTVSANRIDDATLAALHELFTAPVGESPTDPAAAASGRPEIPSPPHVADDGGWATAKARVGILGPVLVRAPGPIDPSRVDLAAEVVAVLSVHPLGVHPNVLGGAVWPRGVTTEVRDATIARVRDWLGQDEAGAYRLQQDRLGRLSLSSDVLSDWHVFCSLASLSRLASTPNQERDLLVRALRLVRGQLAADAAPGRYAWMARTGLEFTVPAVIVDASHRLVELLYNDDPGGAAEAARCGLRADPAAQLLWRDLLWAESAQWGPDGVRSTVGEMVVVLRDMGVELEAETGAVIEELLPGGPVAAATV